MTADNGIGSGPGLREGKYIFEGESWVCPVCGYVYEGKVPEDFICPRCEQPGIIFERITLQTQKAGPVVMR